MNSIFETRFAKVGEAAEHYQQTRLNSSVAACKWAVDCLGNYFSDRLDQEEFLIALLDVRLKVRRVVRVTRGTLDASLVHPREVFRPAIAECSAAILLIHNHPSGGPEPSRQDRQVTKKLKEVGEIVGINVLDHIIVADGKAVSLNEIGD